MLLVFREGVLLQTLTSPHWKISKHLSNTDCHCSGAGAGCGARGGRGCFRGLAGLWSQHVKVEKSGLGKPFPDPGRCNQEFDASCNTPYPP